MNFKIKYTILVFFALIVSCETVVEDPGLDYKKQLVVQGFVTANNPHNFADISKTVPPLEFPEIENVKLGDSIAFLTLNGDRYYYREFCSNSIQCIEYKLDSINPLPGDSLYFEGNAEGNIATAIVKIPEELPLDAQFYYDRKKSINSFSDEDSVSTIYIEFTSNDDFAYRVFRDVFITYTDVVVGSNRENNRLRLPLTTVFYSNEEDLNGFLSNFKLNLIQIHAYQLEMATYEETKFYGEGFDGIFAGNGLNQQGNIDNGVGILVGRLINFIEVEEITEIK